MITERVKTLKEKLVASYPEIDLEPAKILTEGFQESAGLPVVLCKANAFLKQCKEKTVFINEGELIDGSCGSKTRTGIISADGSWNDNYGFIPSGQSQTMKTADGEDFLCMKE